LGGEAFFACLHIRFGFFDGFLKAWLLGDELGGAFFGLDDALGNERWVAAELAEFSHLFLEREHLDLATPVGADAGLAVVKGDDFGDDVALAGELGFFGAVHIPETDEAVVATGNNEAIGREGHGLDATTMGCPVFDFLAFIHLPDGDGAVLGAGGEEIGVGAPGEVIGWAFVLAEDVEFTARGRFPDHDVAVAVSGGEQDAIRAEFGAEDPFGMLADGV
jgi:hypothetical protein